MTNGAIDAAARNDRLYRLLEYSSDGICEVDAEGRCTYCNTTGAQLLGYDIGELVGTSLHEVIHLSATSQAPAECAICRAVKNAQGVKTDEPAQKTHGVLSHRDGRAIPVSYSVVQILAEGRFEGAVISFYDDSEHQRLVGELQDRTAELAESERVKIEFIATLAHELRNPLAPLRTAVQIMRKTTNNATSMAQLREMMERQLEQLVHLVNDLLDTARLSSGQMTLHKARVALQEILQAAVEASEASRASTQNALNLSIPASPLYLDADATRLTQVFTNILNNAAQASAPGGPVAVDVKSDEREVRIDIADAGVGIAREALSRIFDVFTRVGRDARQRHGGLGLGLALAHRLVEMHGGQLVASSEGLGKGSHFLISLPLAGPAPVQAAAAEKLGTEEPQPSPVRALIVDDNIDAADTLSLLLQLGGHTTCLVHDGQEAIKAAAEFKPDIVLLDLGLPGMDGFEVARAIRRLPELGYLALVAITGWGSPEDRARTKQAGFDEHLTKPVDISMIESLLNKLPRRYSSGEGNPPVRNGQSIDTPG
jgi:PAS domain S-box-containing protein